MYAIIMQKHKGTFIIKFFDVFTYPTVELLYLLNCFYENINICKPNTSRFANSERYVICFNFKLRSSEKYIDNFINILKNINSIKESFIIKILKKDLPYKFIQNIEEANILIGKQQITSINNTLQLIQNPKSAKINKLVKNNIQKCNYWCKEFKIPTNSLNDNSNVFLSHRKLN